ncbi:alpha/beta fold hydrolase [Dongia sp.]|uniref:alpha/beta fold hydrolase n=1 Tax=Dongia sp. TaxID=1977262 RepID=UPI0034A23F87
MPSLDLDGVSLWYECVQGPGANHTAIPAVMIQGLGMQASDWPSELVEELASDRRLFVFDNRDAGLSQLFGPAIDGNLMPNDFPDHRPSEHSAPYTLVDMADDVAKLLDAVNVGQAHLVGFSMGGMIAQIVAARHRSHVASLVGLMTSAGQAWLESSAVADQMLRQSIQFEPDHRRLLDMWLKAEEVYAGPTLLPDSAVRRQAIAQSIARAYRPAGIWRQACAMHATGDRQALLGTIVAPSLMIHGEEDPVIDLQQSRHAKTLMPQTEFRSLADTGHALTEDNAAPIADLSNSFWSGIDANTDLQTSIGHSS